MAGRNVGESRCPASVWCTEEEIFVSWKLEEMAGCRGHVVHLCASVSPTSCVGKHKQKHLLVQWLVRLASICIGFGLGVPLQVVETLSLRT